MTWHESFSLALSSGAINRQMMDKFNDILEQFSRELMITRQIFDVNMNNPPATRNQPPVAGAIAWSRSLFSRVRKTMSRFQADADEEMKSEAAAAECLRKYTSLAKTVMQFEKAWFRGWAENVDSMAMYHLKQPIIFTDTKCEPNEIKVGSTLQREPCLKARSVSALQTKIREAKI